MYYGRINKNDIANGPGVRVSIWVSGCRNYCQECFNQEAWDFEYGQPFTHDTILEIVEALDSPYIQGLTILGGEPLDPRNVDQVTELCEIVSKIYEGEKDIWVYTGFKFKDVKKLPIMDIIDVLVDGEFDISKKDISLAFRGSSNQKIIKLKEEINVEESD